MVEIRYLFNIIEQFEKKFGLEVGYLMRLRLEKDSLYDMLKKLLIFDVWDRMMLFGKSDLGQVILIGIFVRIFCFLVFLNFYFFRGGGQGGERKEGIRNKFFICVFVVGEKQRRVFVFIYFVVFW